MMAHTIARGGLLLAAITFSGGCGSSPGLQGMIGPAADGAAGTSAGLSDGGDIGGMADDTIPAGWTGAEALQLQQSFCPTGGPYPPPFTVTETSGAIEGTLTCVEFREFQSLCGYVVDSGATARVLVQPCDLHPTNVPKGDQDFNVTFTLPARADRTSVELYDRFDFYGSSAPTVPMLLGTADVGPGQDGGRSTDGATD
jgi:hypothetical protein